MKRLLGLGVLLGALFANAAFATVELKLVSGGTMLIVVGADGDVSYKTPKLTTFNGWTISMAAGSSYSPSTTPFGLDEYTLTVKGGGTSELDVYLSDTGFNVPVSAGGFMSTFSATTTGNKLALTSQKAWVDPGNAIFGTSAAGFIGTVGPFAPTGGKGTVAGGEAGGPLYSLTLEQIFKTGGGVVSFSADGNITTVPEPASVVLFGTMLVLCASRMRRRRVS
jgi:hypothetical protein